MRYYTQQHPYYCGIDLHARSLYICIVDRDGRAVFHEDRVVNADVLQRTVEPYLPDLALINCRGNSPNTP